jgi:hypothetical protein
MWERSMKNRRTGDVENLQSRKSVKQLFGEYHRRPRVR